MEINKIIIREEVDTTNIAVGATEFHIIATIDIGDEICKSVTFSTYLKSIARVSAVFLSSQQEALIIDLPKNSNVAVDYWEWGMAYFRPASSVESIQKLEAENALEMTKNV